jgi:hypothetical protein
MNQDHALTGLRWSFSIFIVWASVQTFLEAIGGRGEPHLGGHAAVLAAVEALAAIALLVPRVALAAAGVLCGVFAVAGVVSLFAGEAPLRFVYYAATAVLLALTRPGQAPAAP